MPLDCLTAADPLTAHAAGWLASHGLQEGDRFALLAGSTRAYLALTWGALRAGVVPVMVNTALTDEQVRSQITDADVVAVVADEQNAGRVRDALLVDEHHMGRVRPATSLAPVPRTRPMHFTSGTSGTPKGVWAGLLDPARARAWAADETAANPTGPADIHLVCSPLFHSGPHRYAINTLNRGGTVLIQPRFDADQTRRALAEDGVTTAFMVPAHLARLLEQPGLPEVSARSLRFVHHAGAACAAPLKRRAMDTLPTGVLHEFYGSTEGQFTAISPEEWTQRPGSVGRARAGRRLRVTDRDGREVPAGEVGLVWVSAPDFGRWEYWRRPDATANAWRDDFFTVGDLGVVDDDGYLTLSGRRTDLIVTGGVNVYPAEVEQVLLAHPAVADGAVFGVPDVRWGDRVMAAVVPRRGVSVDPDELRAYLRSRLAGFQTPKEVVVVTDLPRTASGKVIRRHLTEQLSDPPSGPPSDPQE